MKEEVQQEALVRNLESFAHFLEYAAAKDGQIVNYSAIARQINCASQTVKEYYKILEDTLIAISIPAFFKSIKKQLQHAPKYYFFDNGVANALRGELSTEIKESSFRFGQLFENLVVNELIKYRERHSIDCHVYHYRTNNGAEIDLILLRTLLATPVAVEIKSNKNPNASDVKSINHILDDYPEAKRIVLCRAERAYVDQGIEFYPYQEGIRYLLDVAIL